MSPRGSLTQDRENPSIRRRIRHDFVTREHPVRYEAIPLESRDVLDSIVAFLRCAAISHSGLDVALRGWIMLDRSSRVQADSTGGGRQIAQERSRRLIFRVEENSSRADVRNVARDSREVPALAVSKVEGP
jgi:hypothetical protein